MLEEDTYRVEQLESDPFLTEFFGSQVAKPQKSTLLHASQAD
jgi:hypothetical protein